MGSQRDRDQVKGKNAEPGRVIWSIEGQRKGDFDQLRSAGPAVIREPLPARQPDVTASYVAITTPSRTLVEQRRSGSRRHGCWSAIATYRQRTAEG